jgi:hypothetical protein
MTDKDIVKALKRCGGSIDCRDCPAMLGGDCIGRMSAAALDLIKRQQLEIKRLTARQLGGNSAASIADGTVKKTVKVDCDGKVRIPKAMRELTQTDNGETVEVFVSENVVCVRRYRNDRD